MEIIKLYFQLSDFICKIIKLYFQSTFVLLRRFLQLTGPGRHEVVERVVGEYVEKRDDGTAALNQPSAEVYICNVAELISLFFAELGYEYSRPQCLHTKGY